jgi:signal transduction histidine kinase
MGILALPLWPAGLLADGVWCGLARQRAVVLPLISRLADLDAKWSAALLRPPPRALLAKRVAELTKTRAGAIAAHSAELRRIERDLHDGAQARLVALSMRIGLANVPTSGTRRPAVSFWTKPRSKPRPRSPSCGMSSVAFTRPS